MPTYNPNADPSVKDLFLKDGESLSRAGFTEPDDYEELPEQAAEFTEFTGRMAAIVAAQSKITVA